MDDRYLDASIKLYQEVDKNVLFPDKKTTNQYNLPLLATQVSSTGVTTIVGVAGVPKPVTKQTVILTYQPQQYQQQVRLF